MVIDQEHLRRQTAGDTELQDELLGLFLQQLNDTRTVLADGRSLPGHAPDDLASILHRLRGAAAAVGARGLVQVFSRAEQDLERSPSPAALDALRAELDQASTALTSLIAAREQAGLAKGGESR